MSSTLESYELIRFAEAFEARLATAGEMLTGRPGLDAEKGWLATALELVRAARAPTAGVLDRVKDLPELEEAREEYAFHQQGLWVDALEKLHAGITFTASSRAPVIEALFPHLKFPQLRRAPREAVLEYATSYERRTKSAYVTRIFGREDFALVRPVMEQVVAAHTAWRSSHEPAPLSLEQEALLREELVTLGRKLDQSLRQARLLAEAALVPVPTVYEAAGLNLKPKRRAGRGLALSDDGLAGFDEPGDSMEPTEAELAEVAALDAGDDVAPTRASEPVAASDAPAAGVEATAGDGDLEAGHDAEATPANGGEGSDAIGAVASTASVPVTTAEATAPVPADGSQAPLETASEGDSHAGPALPPPQAQADGDTSPGESAASAVTSDGGESAPDGAPLAARDAGAPAPRGGRRGRKKAEDSEPAAPEAAKSPSASEAQAPRVRKKKGSPQSAPPTPGAETP
ncbi:hypothetical protein [Corallococcus macrosporus]|uniref:Uncharacterized protein n=2 Tax=Myxococcaceae TaxID=31 RepID=A0A250JU88_9BACT|nr:hypothetical protein [Corallococcus macrosporus]AEI66501.1 hypothetical protein LILAB_23030 [Corallococcus macrosporus]ATB47395.1 hypothetical protein MYMAC_003004 [Corallococcus macrosporus DSM 14697]